MAVQFEIDGPVAIVSIDRPDRRNAVDRDTAAALHDAFTRFDADESLSVAVLTGRGGTFCAGADLKAVAEGRGNRVGREEQGPMGPTYMRLSKPVIAAVEGYAVAGGIELALWCDLRVMAEGATFGVFCRRFGVPLVDGGTVRLARLIGQSRAMDLVLTGRPVGAEEALAFGLANRVVPDGQALPAAVELAKQIAAFPQICMRHDRLSMLEQWGMDEREALTNEARHGQITIASGETRAGAERFRSGAGRGGSFDT
jgi:enoyl-CoA hydratase